MLFFELYFELWLVRLNFNKNYRFSAAKCKFYFVGIYFQCPFPEAKLISFQITSLQKNCRFQLYPKYAIPKHKKTKKAI